MDERKMDLNQRLMFDDLPEVEDIQSEFQHMTDQGHRQSINMLRSENEMLK